MIRKVSAVVIGVALAVALVAAIESLGHRIYPPPANMDYESPVTLQAFFESMPLGAFLFLLAAWTSGAFGGGLLAAVIAGEATFRNCATVGGVILAGAVFNLIAIPHPRWLSSMAPIAIVVSILLANKVALRIVTVDRENQTESPQTFLGQSSIVGWH